MANSLNETHTTNEAKRRAVVERMWLSHYNNILLEKGIITPDQHRKMKIHIATRKPLSMEH